jgi:hypothetical protein
MGDLDSRDPLRARTPCTVRDDEEALEAICHAVGRRLEELARQRFHGRMSEEDFIAAVLKIEAEDIAPHGLNLTASNTIDDWTVFQVRKNGGSDACAAFEFLPETGEFRPVGSQG